MKQQQMEEKPDLLKDGGLTSMKCNHHTKDARHAIAQAMINSRVDELNDILAFFHNTYCTIPTLITGTGDGLKEGKWLSIKIVTPIDCSWNGSYKESNSSI